MATQHDNGIALAVHEHDPNPIGPTRVEECEKIETLEVDHPIEEGVEKISLVGASQTCVTIIQGNGNEDESESESESEASSSGGSSSSSDSDSDSDGDGDGDEDEDGDKKKEEGEVEEGELRDSDDDDESEDDKSEGGDKMFSWSMVDDDDIDVVDYDDDARGGGGPIKSKNELENLPPVPPVEVALEPHHQMLPVGVVMSTLGAQVIVEGVEKHDPLNEGSILWVTESRKPLGLVDEIFGPVKNPYYVVRYNSENEVPVGIHAGTLISFVPEFADYVLKNKDVYKKGYDASGANDEELSDEIEFSDDEKEAEYRRMQRMTKRDENDENPGKRKINRKKVSPKQNVVRSIPDAPAPSLPNHGNSSPFSGIWQGPFGGTTMVPPFPIPLSNAGPNFPTNGVWTNGTMFPQQPQPALLPNGFPANGMQWYPQNTQIYQQLAMPGIPFQQQLHPSQGPLSTAMLPGVQPNMFAQPMYAQGLVGQNQMTFGLSTPFAQIQPPLGTPQQSFPSSELHSSTIPGGPPQFHPGATASHGRNTFHGAGRKGWRPAN